MKFYTECDFTFKRVFFEKFAFWILQETSPPTTPTLKKLRQYDESRPTLKISFNLPDQVTANVAAATPERTPDAVPGEDPFLSVPSDSQALYVTAQSAGPTAEYFSTTNKVQSRIGAIFSKKIPAQSNAAASSPSAAALPGPQRLNGSTFNCLGRQGFFPDVSQRCNTYYFCDATGEALKFQCPLELAFDRQQQACVAVGQVNCSVGGSVGPVEFGTKQFQNQVGGSRQFPGANGQQNSGVQSSGTFPAGNGQNSGAFQGGFQAQQNFQTNQNNF